MAASSVADRMVDIAVARILQQGMRVGLDDLRMEEVIAEAGVSRATAYRRWPSRDDFVADVLVAVVRRTTLIPEQPEDVRRLLALVEEAMPRAEDPQARRDLVVEALRVSVDSDIRRMLASPGFRTHLSVAATYPALPPGRVRDAVGEALVRTDAEFTARRTGVYANLAQLMGYAPTEPDGIATLSSVAGLLMTGLLIRALARPAWLDEREERVLFGQSGPAPWSAPERMVVGTVLTYLVPDPGADWSPAGIGTRLARLGATLAELYAEPSYPLPEPPDGP